MTREKLLSELVKQIASLSTSLFYESERKMSTTDNQSEIALTQNSAIDSFVAAYYKVARKTVHSTLELAVKVLEAKTVLTKESDFALFRERCALSESAAKKLCVIAQKAERIKHFYIEITAVRESVEMSESALYAFSQMSDADYDNFLDAVKADEKLAITAKSISDFDAAKVAKKAEADTKAEAEVTKDEVPKAAEDESEVIFVDLEDIKQSAEVIALETAVQKANAEVVNVATKKQDAYEANADVVAASIAMNSLSCEKKNLLIIELNEIATKYAVAIALSKEAQKLAA